MLNKNFHKNQNPTEAIFCIGSSSASSKFTPNVSTRPVFGQVNLKQFNQINDKVPDRIFCFFDSILCVMNDSSLYGIGSSYGNNDTMNPVAFSPEAWEEVKNSTIVDVGISGSSLMILYSNQKVYGIGGVIDRFRTSGPQQNQVTKLSDDELHGKIIHIAMGYSCSYLLNDKHEVFSYGDSQGLGRPKTGSPCVNYGQVLKHGDYIKQLSSGYSQVVAVSKNGYAYFHGYGCHGEGAMSNSPTEPTAVTWFSSQDILIDQVNCGIFHTMWLTKDNQLYISGRNQEMQLGNTSVTSTHVPQKVVTIDAPILEIQCGGSSSAALTTNNKLFFTGSFDYLSADSEVWITAMTDLLEALKEKNTDRDQLEKFSQYYTDPTYEKSFSIGSAQHFVMFKKIRSTTIPRLFTLMSQEKLCDIDIVLYW